MFSLKSTCNRIQVDKASINKINNKSAFHTNSMKYSGYVNQNSGKYKTITEGQVTSISMINVTPHTVTIDFTYVSNPVYFEMALVNIQDATDRHAFELYASPYTFTRLRPNSYYTITAKSTFISTNTYSKVFPSAILTLFEGPPRDLSMNTILNKSAVLNFTPSIGDPTYFTLNIIDTNDPTNIQFYQHIKPTFTPFYIIGLQPNITYDVSLSSYYSDTNNTYTVYKPAFFKTYYEDNPVLYSIMYITNMGASIQFEYTGSPSYNLLELTNVNDTTDTYTIKDTELYNNITFDDLRVDSSYNLTLTSVYITGNTYSKGQLNAFHTWNENEIPSAQVLSILGDSVRISFTAAIGNVLSYNIYLIDENQNIFQQFFQTVPAFVLFSNLEVYTNYYLFIESVYIENRIYTYFYPNNIHTLNEGPVTDIYYNYISNNSARISFPASPGINMCYNIKYKGAKNNTKTYSINGIKTTEVNLTNLSIHTSYSVTVTTYYILHNHYYSLSKTNLFTTANEGPTTIYNVEVISNTNDIAISFINTYGYPSDYIFHATSSSTDFSGNFIGLANRQYTYTLSGLSTDMSYDVYVITKYDTNQSYTTTWPNKIRI